MIRNRHTLVATLLSIPPVIVVAVLVDRLLPPPPSVPSVVAANDRSIDATHVRAKAPHRDKSSYINRPFAYHLGSDAP